MNIKDYQEFVRQAEKGEILIGVEPAVAREFFTTIDHSVIKEKIGEALFIERFLVKTCWLLEFICLLAGIIVTIFAMKWYSIIIIPVMFMVDFILFAKASVGRQRIGSAIFLLLFVLYWLTILELKEQLLLYG